MQGAPDAKPLADNLVSRKVVVATFTLNSVSKSAPTRSQTPHGASWSVHTDTHDQSSTCATPLQHDREVNYLRAKLYDQRCLLDTSRQQLARARAVAWDQRCRADKLTDELHQSRQAVSNITESVEAGLQTIAQQQDRLQAQYLQLQADRVQLQDSQTRHEAEKSRLQQDINLLCDQNRGLSQLAVKFQEQACASEAKVAQTEACCLQLLGQNQDWQQAATARQAQLIAAEAKARHAKAVCLSLAESLQAEQQAVQQQAAEVERTTHENSCCKVSLQRANALLDVATDDYIMVSIQPYVLCEQSI